MGNVRQPASFRGLLVCTLVVLRVSWQCHKFDWCCWKAHLTQPTATSLPGPHLRRRVALRGQAEARAGSGPSPEAWRDFRARLISGGLKLTTDDDSKDADEAPDSRNVLSTVAVSKRRTVAPKNEELLREQNLDLWNEYINGAWAHLSPVEAGGLLCRIPLAAQLVNSMRGNKSGGESQLGETLKARLLSELPQPENNRSREDIFLSWSRNTEYCFRLAESVIQEGLERIMETVSDKGQVDVGKLNNVERELIIRYSQEQETWQSVCLVLKVPSGSVAGASDAVAINRPCARGIDERLARILLLGLQQQQAASDADEETISKFAQAFGDEAGVYFGGPEQQDQPALLVHGFGELQGAVEVAPGTRIFTGGALAAIDGVLAGRYSPLDFRWFIGRHQNLNVLTGEWCAIACARPIALKQCLGLPKPLWHEVMELCGGENSVLSRMEFAKRRDLEEADEGAEESEQ